MKKLLIALLMLLFATPVFAEPFLYLNLSGNITDDISVIIEGLPDSPIEAEVIKVNNPNDPNDDLFYKVNYDFGTLLDGDYTITAKAKTMWGESGSSAPLPFTKSMCGSPQNLGLLLSE